MKIDAEYIKNLFDEISDYYDKMNSVISLGMHYYIKKSALKLLDIKPESRILDLCTGTGDIAEIISKKHPDTRVTGIDSSLKMLEKACKKNIRADFQCADVLNMPFSECSFDCAAIAFGLRNIPYRAEALREINRVLKKGGLFLHLDFAGGGFFSSIYDIFLKIIIRCFNVNISRYEYLIASKNAYPSPDKLIKEFEQAGFRLLKRKNFLSGIISAQLLQKN